MNQSARLPKTVGMFGGEDPARLTVIEEENDGSIYSTTQSSPPILIKQPEGVTEETKDNKLKTKAWQVAKGMMAFGKSETVTT